MLQAQERGDVAHAVGADLLEMGEAGERLEVIDVTLSVDTSRRLRWLPRDLKRLYAYAAAGDDFEALARFSHLEQVGAYGMRDVTPLLRLKHLRSVALGLGRVGPGGRADDDPGAASVAPLAKLPALDHLDVQTLCRVQGLEALVSRPLVALQVRTSQEAEARSLFGNTNVSGSNPNIWCD